MKRYLIPFLALFAAASGAALAQHTLAPSAPAAEISSPTSFVQQAFDVLGYDAELDLTAAPGPEMTGVVAIRLRWVQTPSESAPFYFHLRSLTITNVTYDGTPVTAVAEETPASPVYRYRLVPPASAKAGDTATIRISYGGTMTGEAGSPSWGGVHSISNVLFAMGVGLFNNYVSATQHWLPCYDHPSDKATFRGRFKVKPGMVVASNGVLAVEQTGDGNVIYDWRHDFPCATYLYTFAVSSFVPLAFGDGSLPMVVYSLPADTAATRTSFKLLPRMVSAFERRYGAYPFEKVGYVNAPTAGGAMEHETMITFDVRLSRNRDTVNSTGAHELAHMWWGDLVSPLDFRHTWLTESFATFSETIWEEDLYGYTGYLNAQTGQINEYLNQVAPREGIFALYDYPRTSPSHNYPTTIYAKGAVVVGMLRYEMGDSAFFGALRDYLTRYALGTATTEQMRTVLEEHHGEPLDWFFDQWVYRGGWPRLDAAVKREATGSGLNKVTMTLIQLGSAPTTFYDNLPVEIGFHRSGDSSTFRLIEMTERAGTFVLDSIPDYTTVSFNRGPSVRALLQVSTISGVSTDDGATGGVRVVSRPNPLTGGAPFRIAIEGAPNCSGLDYEIYESSGRRLMLGHGDSCEFTVETDGFAAGTYVLRVKLRGTTYDVPLVLVR